MTFSKVSTNFKRFLPETYETGLIKSHFSLPPEFMKFHKLIGR